MKGYSPLEGRAEEVHKKINRPKQLKGRRRRDK
jgi:hypothetical protein